MLLSDIIEKINSKDPFAFSRFGDGEWLNIRKTPGQNCDGNIYYPDLGERLAKIVSKKQDYILGAQDYKKWELLSDVDKYTANSWVDADVFHKASMEGNLQPLFEVLNQVYVVYVGNETLKSLTFIDEFIQIPHKNVWLEYNAVIEKIKKTFSNFPKVYLFSAGMCSNVFIDDLWRLNKSNFYIDVGSVFDPYVGRKTRSYHNNLKITG